MPTLRLLTLAVLLISIASNLANADGLIPDRINQVIIQGRFAQKKPEFLLIFSTKPLLDERERPIEKLSGDSITELKNTPEQLVIKLYGKPASNGVRCDYFFGTLHDKEMPWNDGTDFSWQDWEKLSPDIWDNICILSAATQSESLTPLGYIESVTIRRGGMKLFDSRATETYPNKKRFTASLRRFELTPSREKYPVLNLASDMRKFKRIYYELDRNPILITAYSDLGQTEKRKYANRGNNWCSEYASYVYRQNGIETPDPNASDVHWKNMREFFEHQGKVYPARQVAQWPDKKKIELIKPGTFVTIYTGENSTHSLFFTKWVMDRDGITKYAGVSGNNKGMVWAHAPLKLPTPDKLAGMSAEQLQDYDNMIYFAVPGEPTSDTSNAEPSDVKLRTWKDSTGQFKIEAQFLTAENGMIRLKKADGEKIEVPLSRLSKEDQAVVERLLKDQSAPAPK